jgi:dihydropteroate synthase
LENPGSQGTAQGSLAGGFFDKPYAVMGILNVTPDSFFDGGRHATVQAAIEHGRTLIGEGADILDIGGESTRPGARPVDAEEECGRIIPVITAVARESSVPISVDTTKSAVARRALDAGASIVNDISGGRFDRGMAALVAQRQCTVIVMHSRETPATMQDQPQYTDVVAEVKQELLACAGSFAGAGVRRENIILDPGIGFAKRLTDNCILLRRLGEIVSLGYAVCVGTSRKSFIGRITNREAQDRLAGSLAGVAPAFYAGARIFRVHDVWQTKDALKVLDAILHS